MMFRHQLAVYSPITASAEARAIGAALRLTADARPRLLRLLLEEYDAESGMLCGSGTQALQLAILLATRTVGVASPVALPAFSCFDVASAAVGAGADIALYDIDPETLAPRLESLERVLAGGARVAVVAPLYGIPIEWEPLDVLAGQYGALLIEDAAQGHGASWRGRKLGTLASISTLSFGRGKGWTGGHGGAVLCRHAESSRLDVSAAIMRDESATIAALLAQWLLGQPGLYGIPRAIPVLALGVTTYRQPVSPTAMTRAAAAAVLANRRASSKEAVRRRENALASLARVGDGARIRAIRVQHGAVPGYLRLPLRASGGIENLAAVARARVLGIERSYPCSLDRLQAVATRLVGRERRWPGASTLADQLFTCPTHSLVSLAEREEIAQYLRA